LVKKERERARERRRKAKRQIEVELKRKRGAQQSETRCVFRRDRKKKSLKKHRLQMLDCYSF